MNDNWVVSTLESALSGWNDKLAEIWALVSQTPARYGRSLSVSIPLWLVPLLGSLLITVLSFVLILTVYGRFFKIFIYTAIALLPLASFAGEATARTGQTFLRSYVGVCMEGAVIVLACVIYSAFLSGGSTALDESLPAVTMVWQYLGQLLFNMLVLTGLVKGANRLVREMMGV